MFSSHGHRFSLPKIHMHVLNADSSDAFPHTFTFLVCVLEFCMKEVV